MNKSLTTEEQHSILKNQNYIVKIQSDHRKEDIFYDVDIKNMVCPCNQFTRARFNYELFDPRRLCKHLIAAYYETNSRPDTLKPVEAAIDYFYSKGIGHPMSDCVVMGKLNDNKEIVVFYDKYRECLEEESPSWVTIYYNEKCYGYSFWINTWAYTSEGDKVEIGEDNKAAILHWLHKRQVFQEQEIDYDEEEN